MQQRHPVKYSTSLYQRLNEEAQRRRKEARGTPPGIERERRLRKGAAGGQRLPDDRVAFISRFASTDVMVDYRFHGRGLPVDVGG